jgi:late competence protein required for DNA uptake (superfamily II DNA/RNA helicase)
MLHMHCHRCNLTLEVRSAYLTMEYCPRCIAHARIATPMALRNDQPYADSTTGEKAISVRRSSQSPSALRDLRLRP